MTPSSRIRPLFLLLLFLIWLPFDGQTAGPPATAPTPAPPAAMPPENSSGQPVGPPRTESDQEKEYQDLRHRYRHDPTGVRARLGMCREEHDGGHRHGHGHGHGRGRGQGRDRQWDTP
ncbi:MAG: hypothetical protein LBD10_08860 [Desulfobulbus sp.]|jgi:hypothetical protein|uniref:hypothetical protein n=1 Tax=Desulfobulbus sp. TaxID=895 RepID=UPI00283EBB9F|nr:hypothetical protein [Desulfobulbus sp.]MDR2550291.1 hypothetical protein [Desulfobulbus sp.]